jgi:uncharacterized membrane protein
MLNCPMMTADDMRRALVVLALLLALLGTALRRASAAAKTATFGGFVMIGRHIMAVFCSTLFALLLPGGIGLIVEGLTRG